MDKKTRRNRNKKKDEKEVGFWQDTPIGKGSPIRQRPEMQNRRSGGHLFPVGWLAGQPLSRCVGAGRASVPVRRHSQLVGREGTFWRPTDHATTREVLVAAERFDRDGKQPGERNGPLGHVALEILRLFHNLVSHRTGRLDPAQTTIARMIGRAKSAVVEALKKLRHHGFLDWLRRYEPTGNETGPQVKQTSNAYRMAVPQKAKRYTKVAVPLPDDEAQRQAEIAAEYKRMLDQLTNTEKAGVMVEDEGLAAALGRLGAAMDAKRERDKERESAERSESLSQIHLIAESAARMP